MKRIFIWLLSFSMLLSGCSGLKNILSARDAEAALREELSLGSEFGGSILSKKGAFSKETLMSDLMPEDFQKILNTLETLGLSKDIGKFSATLGTAAEQTVEKSVPIFLLGIKQMSLKDAVQIVKNGGTAATDYLRRTMGDTLRKSISPVMHQALENYKLETEWNNLIAPVKIFAGDKLNLSLSNLISGLVANMMFNKIAEKETAIRTKAAERKSALLQKVFGKIW